MTISIKPTASGSTIEQDGSTVLSVESDRSVDIDSGTLHVDATNNNVGIGTTSPDFKLEVVGGTNNGIHVKDAESATVFGGLFTQASSLALFARSNHALNFGTNDTERMRIDSSGNTILGSNTSTTAYNKLNIYGPATTLNGIYMEKQSQVVVQMGFKADTGTDFFIGTGSYTLGTYGVYLANTGTSWISVSDERQKDIIEPIENALTKVNTLRAVIGKYKHDEEGVRRSFLIAQDVQAVFPEAVEVQKNEEALLGLSYTDTIPLLVAAIKEQQDIIKALETRIQALENA